MEIHVDTITTSPTSLLLGCVVRGEQDSWVKFCKVVIPVETIPKRVLRDLLLMDDRYVEDLEPDEPLFEVPATND